MTEKIKYNIGDGKEIIAEYDENGIMEITRECFEMLIEKQIPKKPWGKYNMCRTCGIVALGRPDYCPNCGQRIDWGNENDRED